MFHLLWQASVRTCFEKLLRVGRNFLDSEIQHSALSERKYNFGINEEFYETCQYFGASQIQEIISKSICKRLKVPTSNPTFRERDLIS